MCWLTPESLEEIVINQIFLGCPGLRAMKVTVLKSKTLPKKQHTSNNTLVKEEISIDVSKYF